MKELLMNNFKFIMVKVAAMGLDDSWLGKIITNNELENLIALKKKYGINIAGEGGEYESIVLDAPLFKKKIEIVESKKIIESENNADLEIICAKLLQKF
jgi:asparagine synthase (glutamine-hydrolysing)